MMILILVFPLCFIGALGDVHTTDLITSLPGANFDISFKQYSGYLAADDYSNLHYWLLESQNDPAKDPLLLWLNGGPGCSSLEGLLTENGPFRVTNMNATIEENVYSWNKIANVLYLESPTTVGFSYTTNASLTTYGDNQTALLNYNALKKFFTLYTEYQTRDFFISGESYAGVYLPTLAMYLLQDADISKRFKGMAIGNGAISDPYLTNSVPPLFYEHFLVGERMWNNMTAACCKGNGMTCDYLDILNTGGKGDADCFRQVVIISALTYLGGLDPYNIYSTCYVDSNIQKRKRTVYYEKTFLKRFGLDFKKLHELQEKYGLVKHMAEASASSDTQQYPDCYYDGITMYLGRDDVRQALHIPDFVPAWQECSDFNYDDQYDDMAYQIRTVISAGVRVLIYNGDTDTVCNGMGDHQFIDSFGYKQLNDTVPWWYVHDYDDENAGWQTLYEGVHFLSVRGSGHFVPMDKPREALQMITNFIRDMPYNTATGINTTPAATLTKSASMIAPSFISNFFFLILFVIVAKFTR